MIYQHLIIYVFVHVMHCTHDQSLLRNFKEELQKWKDLDDVAVIEHHQYIREYLMDLYRRGLQLNPNLHPQSLLNKLVALDDIKLSAQVALMVDDDDKYKQVIDRRGPGAQALLDLLQARLNFAVDPAYKVRHVKALIRLSRASGLYPDCLVLENVSYQPSPVAGGSFGDVHKGRFQGRTVAVKVLKVYETADIKKLLKEFSSEAVTWQQLSYPNLLPFYGVCRVLGRLCLVCPWMENGNLVHFLANCTSNVDCVLLFLDVAQGLKYLHNEDIIHGDLKGLNILISPSRRACIADFGFATAMHSASTFKGTTTTLQATGTLRWQAPELLPDMLGRGIPTHESYNTTATDVYAFALVGYEMFSGDRPFQDIQNDYQFMVALQRGRRPSYLKRLIRGLNFEIWHLIENCWATEPSERPSAGEIVKRLRCLPNLPQDRRPPDNFSISLPSQVRANYPLSTLARVLETLTR